MGFILIDLIIVFVLVMTVAMMVRSYLKSTKANPGMDLSSSMPVDSLEAFQKAATENAVAVAGNLERMQERLAVLRKDTALAITLKKARLACLKSGAELVNPQEIEQLSLRIRSLESKLADIQAWETRATQLREALTLRSTEVVEQAELTRREEALDNLAAQIHTALDDLGHEATEALAKLDLAQ